MSILDQARLLLRLFWQPAAAMSAILDQGSLLFASVTVLIVSLLTPRIGFSFYTPLLLLAVVYVPGLLLITQLIGGLGGVSAGFQRDYSPLLTCASMAYSAANIPLILISRALPIQVLGPLMIVTYIYFAVLIFFAVRTVFGVGNGVAAGAVALSWIPLAAAAFLWGPLRFIFGWLASPFFLFYAYYFLGGEFTNLGAGFRQRQSFRRMLEAATVNSHDADARYQLGLIYQQRRQYSEAIQRFKEAVTIDPKETDAHFQLGRIALEQGRLNDAFQHFQTVINQNEKHHSHEILRELGRMYLATKQCEDARRELAVYVAHREYDPEGLFYYGQALEGLGQAQEARAAYVQAIEAAAASPHYRRRQTARWSRMAQKQVHKLAEKLN